MGESTKSWIVDSLGGINLFTLIAAAIAITWAFANGYITQDRADSRIAVIEGSLSNMGKKFDDIENQIDAIRTTNTTIAIMEINIGNAVSSLNRIAGEVDALQEGQRDIQSKVRDLERAQQ